MNKFSDSLGPTSVRTNNLRQLIRKCPTLTLAVQTSPTARLHLHHHGGALRRLGQGGGLNFMFRDVDQLRLPDPYYSGAAGFVGSTLEQLHQDMSALELPADVPESVRRYRLKPFRV
jgi:hypothetical protein